MELKKNTLPSPLQKKCKRHLILLILSLMIFGFVANIYAALYLMNPETRVLNVPFGIRVFIFLGMGSLLFRKNVKDIIGNFLRIKI